MTRRDLAFAVFIFAASACTEKAPVKLAPQAPSSTVEESTPEEAEADIQFECFECKAVRPYGKRTAEFVRSRAPGGIRYGIPHIFCSKQCNDDYHERRRLEREDGNRVCHGCGDAFSEVGATNSWCSDRCRDNYNEASKSEAIRCDEEGCSRKLVKRDHLPWVQIEAENLYCSKHKE